MVALSRGLHHLCNNDPEVLDKSIHIIIGLVEQYQQIRKKDNVESAIASILSFMDDEIKEALPKVKKEVGGISCKKGCSFCCKINVSITKDEATLLKIGAKSEGVSIDWQRLTRQVGHDDMSWDKLDPEDRSCVFLVDNKCSIYEYRPSNCRKQLAVSDPKICDTSVNQDENVTYLNLWKVEIIQSVVMTVSESGNMAEMLLKI